MVTCVDDTHDQAIGKLNVAEQDFEQLIKPHIVRLAAFSAVHMKLMDEIWTQKSDLLCFCPQRFWPAPLKKKLSKAMLIR
jgi:hypothetical protein